MLRRYLSHFSFALRNAGPSASTNRRSRASRARKVTKTASPTTGGEKGSTKKDLSTRASRTYRTCLPIAIGTLFVHIPPHLNCGLILQTLDLNSKFQTSNSKTSTSKLPHRGPTDKL